MSKAKIVVALVLVFVIGGLSGSLITGMLIRRQMEVFRKGDPMPLGHFFMGRMARNLNLTAAQRLSIKKIVDNMQTDLFQFREQYRPQMEEIITKYTALIEKQLNDGQRSQMRQMMQKMQCRPEGRRHHRKSRMHHGMGREMGRSGPPPETIQRLRQIYANPNLSNEQREKIDRIIEESIKEINTRLANPQP